jgi:hypothetical protein
MGKVKTTSRSSTRDDQRIGKGKGEDGMFWIMFYNFAILFLTKINIIRYEPLYIDPHMYHMPLIVVVADIRTCIIANMCLPCTA